MTRRAFIKAAVVAIAATIAGSQDDDDDERQAPGRPGADLCRDCVGI